MDLRGRPPHFILSFSRIKFHHAQIHCCHTSSTAAALRWIKLAAMSLERPSRSLQPASPSASVRASYESAHPFQTPHPIPTPLSPVAQSIERKNSQASPTNEHVHRELPDPPHEDSQPERPSLSLNRARHSWRSTRSAAHDDRDDAKSYRAISTHDYGAPGRSSIAREVSNPHHEHRSSSARDSNPRQEHRSSTARDCFSDPRHDPRYQYYDHPYYNHPYAHPYHGPPPHPRNATPRASWRSSATVGVSPSRAPSRTSKTVPPPKEPADEPSDDNDSEDEVPPSQPSPRKHQRPLTWGYEGYSTPPPPPQEVIMRLPFTEWMNSGLKERAYRYHVTWKVVANI